MNRKTQLSAAVVVAVVGLAGCGGGGGSGAAASGARVTGVITELSQPAAAGALAGAASGGNARITVNDVAYTLADDVRIEVEDAEGKVADLAEGQVVTLHSATDDHGVNLATAITMDDEVEGVVFAVDAAAGTMNVMGLNVEFGQTTRFERDDQDTPIDAHAIDSGYVVEVHGYPSGTGIIATRIEVKAPDWTLYDDEFELKGVIISAAADAINVAGAAIGTDSNTQLDDMPTSRTQWPGLYVEVKTTADKVDLGSGTFTATEIELEDDDESHGDDGDEMEIEGVLSVQGNAVTISGRTVKVSERISREVLASFDGKLVEVEGHFTDGALVIDHIELEDGD
ncbi:MAG: DUF5666 domain-containing protein [Thiohalomonadaceae bacterium]